MWMRLAQLGFITALAVVHFWASLLSGYADEKLAPTLAVVAATALCVKLWPAKDDGVLTLTVARVGDLLIAASTYLAAEAWLRSAEGNAYLATGSGLVALLTLLAFAIASVVEILRAHRLRDEEHDDGEHGQEGRE